MRSRQLQFDKRRLIPRACGTRGHLCRFGVRIPTRVPLQDAECNVVAHAVILLRGDSVGPILLLPLVLQSLSISILVFLRPVILFSAHNYFIP